jgi:hypothetical protein
MLATCVRVKCVKYEIANKMSLSSLKTDCTIVLFIHFKRATCDPRTAKVPCHAVPDTSRYIMQTLQESYM